MRVVNTGDDYVEFEYDVTRLMSADSSVKRQTRNLKVFFNGTVEEKLIKTVNIDINTWFVYEAPMFKFIYPSTWTVEDESVYESFRLVVTSPAGSQIVFAGESADDVHSCESKPLVELPFINDGHHVEGQYSRFPKTALNSTDGNYMEDADWIICEFAEDTEGSGKKYNYYNVAAYSYYILKENSDLEILDKIQSSLEWVEE
jgi:hypothetical protein